MGDAEDVIRLQLVDRVAVNLIFVVTRGGGGPMAKNGEKWRKMAKNGDGEFGFFICQIRHFSPIFDFGISHLTHFQTANHLETLQSHYWHQYRTNATHIE